MARSIACVAVASALWMTMTGTAAGQAAVESSVIAAGTSTAAASAAGIGGAISGLASTFEKTVRAGQQDSDANSIIVISAPAAGKRSSTAARKRLRSTDTPPAPAKKWEDPGGIQAGLSYGDLVRRFGPPSMEIVGDEGRSLTYSGPNGAFQVEVRDEKVASVEKPKS